MIMTDGGRTFFDSKRDFLPRRNSTQMTYLELAIFTYGTK
jgi:DNA-dependent RNA polymerase auxiliary subunit epsilon